MPLSDQELGAWADAYVRAQPEAVDRFEDAGAEDGWRAILAVLSRSPPEAVVAQLAAGPLEDLLQRHGEAFIDRVEDEARRSVPFRHLLGGVWKAGTPAVWARVERARGAAW